MWLIQNNILKAMQDAKASGKFNDAKILAEEEDENIDYNIATFKVKGVLTEEPDVVASLFGGGNVTYNRIISFIENANKSSDIDEIRLEINSPGGTLDGMFEAMEAIRNSKKPVISLVKKAASAAYFLASQSDKIFALNKASSVGSVGAVFQIYNDENIYSITNTDSPNKRPDVTTEEGKAVLRSELDDIYELFAEMAAIGRGVSIDTVRNNFGKGAMLLADDAIKAGMIDGFNNNAVEAKSMDLKELKAKHPDVYEQAYNIGAKEERERVEAHLTLGQQAGAVDIAIKAIEAGDGLTAKLQAKYMAASMNKKDLENRSTEDTSAADQVQENVKAEENFDFNVFSNVAKNKGLKMEVGRG